MWLPKDERRLLQGYFVKIGEVDKQHDFSLDALLWFIKSGVFSYQPPTAGPQYEEDLEYYKNVNRIRIANKALKERELITTSIVELDPTYDPITISLTINGYDLARKYNSWWLWIKLWYDEYVKNHPIWLIVSYIAGIISMLLINWLSKISG